MLLRYCLGIDVAAMDSMYCLISEAGEIIFMPEKHPHTLTGFMDVISKFENSPQEQISIPKNTVISTRIPTLSEFQYLPAAMITIKNLFLTTMTTNITLTHSSNTPTVMKKTLI